MQPATTPTTRSPGARALCAFATLCIGLTVLPANGAQNVQLDSLVLDAGYGAAGEASAHFGTLISEGSVYDIAPLADGSNVVLAPLGLWKLAPSGAIDTSFGISGSARLTDTQTGTAITGIEALSNGKIAAYSQMLDADGQATGFQLAVFSNTGTLDASFAGGGVLRLPCTNIEAIKAGTSGAIYVLQSAVFGSCPQFPARVIRVLANGRLDTWRSDPEVGSVYAFDAAPDGRVYVLRAKQIAGTGNTVSALSRLNVDGSWDKGYGPNGEFIDAATAGINGLLVGTDGTAYFLNEKDTSATVKRISPAGVIDTGYAPTLKSRTRILTIAADGGLVLNEPQTITLGAPLLAKLTPTGAFDSAFGISGRLAITPANYAGGPAVAFDAGGKLLIGAMRLDPNYPPPTASTYTPRRAIALRYSATGVWDTTYGNGGVTTLAPDAPSSDLIYGNTAIRDVGSVFFADGSTVVLGNTTYSDTRQASVLARYSPSGTLVTSFGSGGFVALTRTQAPSIQVIPYGDLPQLHALQDGGLIVGTLERRGQLDDFQFRLERLNANGVPSPSFGGAGALIWPQAGLYSGTLTSSDGVSILGEDTSGRLYLQGRQRNAGNASDTVYVVRFTALGAPDPSYGISGRLTLTTTIGPGSWLGNHLLGDGSFVTLWQFTPDGNTNIRLEKFDAQGQRDASFGTNGVTLIPRGGNTYMTFAGLSDGRLFLRDRFSATDNSPDRLNRLIMVKPNGALDASFGAQGVMTISLFATDAQILPSSGKVLLRRGFPTEFVRLNLDGSVDHDFFMYDSLVNKFGGSVNVVRNIGGKDYLYRFPIEYPNATRYTALNVFRYALTQIEVKRVYLPRIGR